MTTDNYKLTLQSLYETWVALAEFGASLTEDQWKTPTKCPGWSVQDNLSHLIGTERSLGGLGDTTHKATNLEHVKNPIGEMNEHQVDARRSLSGAAVLQEFNEITKLRKAFFDAAPENFFTDETMTPIGKAPMATFLQIRAMDCWVHEQDMRRALGKPGSEASISAELSVDRLCRTLPMVVGKRAQTPDGASVVINIIGPVKRKFVISVIDGRATVVETPKDKPVMEISFDSNTFVELATGRTPGEQLRDKIEITGDVALGERVANSLNMMI